MVRNTRWPLLVLGLLLATGCASRQEALAAKDRQINNLEEEKSAVARQLADARATRGVLEKQLEAQEEENRRLAEKVEELRRERERLAGELQQAATEEPRRSGAEVDFNDPDVEVLNRSNGEVVLRISDRVTFNPGSAKLTKRGQRILGRVADVLNRHSAFAVSVEGHTDDTPLKKTKDRWKTNKNLSIARALQVENYLKGPGNVSSDRMRIVGYGSTMPLVPGSSEKARAKNRRVELVLYRPPER